MIELQEWLKLRDTQYVPRVRGEEDLRRNISDGTPFGQALTEMAIRDLIARVQKLERANGEPKLEVRKSGFERG